MPAPPDAARRALLAALVGGVTLGAGDAGAGQPKDEAGDPSVYVPKAHVVGQYETAIGGTADEFRALPRADVLARAQGIQPFELEVAQLEGKFNLFQERPEAGKAAALTRRVSRGPSA
ncbi:MAG: hypothetical protein R2708_18470 [Vicinamibacterales bacterium]